MLEAVGHPIVVNPDRVLAKIAKERNWPVETFANPVRVREGEIRPSAPIGLIALSAGIVSISAASVYLLVRVRRLSEQLRAALMLPIQD